MAEPGVHLTSLIDQVFKAQKERQKIIGQTSPAQRKEKLNKLYRWIREHQQDIRQALANDLHKPHEETDLTEIFIALAEIKHIIKKLSRWMKPRKVRKTLTFLTTTAWVRYEPRGVVLVIAPWNFPFHLTVVPLAAAMAAGNTVFIKPSEFAPATSALIKRMVEELFDREEVAVFEGDYRVAQALLQKSFDHIFFTGSTKVGKLIMKAAAEHLTSVTLELGGKSPVVVDKSARLKDAARKIAFGKYLNSGQTCIAPDYLLVHSAVRQEFETLLKKEIARMFGENSEKVKNAAYARIITPRHQQRLQRLLDESLQQGAQLLTGGQAEAQQRFFEPTVVSNIAPQSPLMQEEIFGPILPIIPFETPEQATQWINRLDKPLALYVFSENHRFIDYISKHTASGGVCINDLMIQYLHLNLPFGGVKQSGWGNAHGFYGFKAFSYERAFVKQGILSPLTFLYPPYNPFKEKLIGWLIRWLA
jgi:aldehyde dehydrogenase (NAD+)